MKKLPHKRANDIAQGAGDVIADINQIEPTSLQRERRRWCCLVVI